MPCTGRAHRRRSRVSEQGDTIGSSVGIPRALESCVLVLSLARGSCQGPLVVPGSARFGVTRRALRTRGGGRGFAPQKASEMSRSSSSSPASPAAREASIASPTSAGTPSSPHVGAGAEARCARRTPCAAAVAPRSARSRGHRRATRETRLRPKNARAPATARPASSTSVERVEQPPLLALHHG